MTTKLDAYMRNISVEGIGPKEARLLLDTGDSSHVDWDLVAQYTKDMKYGKWSYPGGVIEITTSGVLKDGFHRLLAVERAGVVLPMIIVRNVTNN